MARNALMEFLQAASNEAAGAVSGPVDMLSWGLRKAGVPVPKNALLSSDWMAHQGLTRPVQSGIPQVAGATLGLLSPVAVAAKAPQIARGLLQAQANAAAPRTLNPQLGAVVYHGSPHKFDAFDSSKIGTGEGAQAYGHGLYFAESPDVAGSYQKALSSGKVTPPTPANEAERAVLEVAQYRAQQLGGDVAQGLQHMARNTADPQRLGVIQDLMNRTRKDGGALYKVDLPDEKIARLLDWDKPLRDQPSVLKSMKMDIGPPLEPFKDGAGWSIRNSATGEVVSRNWGDEEMARKFASLGGANADANLSGQAMYRKLHEDAIRSGRAMPAAEKERLMVQQLRAQGIPGIRYLDGGSRGAGGGTSNYVVFPGEENALKILERNSKPLP